MTSLRTTPWPRLLTALAALALPMLGLTALTTPAAAAPGSSSTKQEIVIHSDETVDVTYTVKIEGLDPETYCNDDGLGKSDKSFEVEFIIEGDTCTSKAMNIPFDDVNESEDVITHKGDEYTATVGTTLFSFSDGDDEQALSVTFPGKVVSSEPEGEVSGNTVTWTKFEGVTEVKATGKDGSSNAFLWIILAVVVLVIVAVVVLLVVLTRGKKSNAAMPPAGGYMPGAPYVAQPGQAPQGYQPGQAIPPQPGYQPPQAGYQPGQTMPPQPGYQPPQAGYQPPQAIPPQPGYQPPQNPNGSY